VTAGGLSSGIAMSLHLVDRLASRELAIRTARQLDYAWNPDAGVVTPRRPVITPT
jgi:transcriptional regulator GlxA family with amidase domain